MAQILIIDDEERVRRMLSALLLEQSHQVVETSSGAQALDVIEVFQADLVLLDLNLPGVDGFEILRRLQHRHPRTAVILMTSFGTIASAVEAMRSGAFDYLTKPLNGDELLVVVARALEVQRLSQELELLRTNLESVYGFSEIVGISPAIKEVFRIMAKVAPVNATVLITGESGTGKELVARAIHRRSERAKASFVAVNCGAIPPALVESEFFGHEKGAFTDAHVRRVGRFEEAHRGTLFLDEVGDLPLEAQAKLLRALQERQIQPVGGKPKPVDVRVIAATNKDLTTEMQEGRFREDLFWRLNVVPLKLPPLRERKEDLSLLCDFFVEHFNRELGAAVDSVSPEARRLLLDYDWPGNVRELENTICRSMIFCESSQLTLLDLPPRIRAGNPGARSAVVSELDTMNLAEVVQQATERLEKRIIAARLERYQGNRAETAASLGIDRKTLFNKLRHYRLSNGREQ